MTVPASDIVRDHAAKRLAAFATPPGALGRLGARCVMREQRRSAVAA